MLVDMWVSEDIRGTENEHFKYLGPSKAIV